MSVYLDYNASAPIDQRVLDEMILTYQNKVGNADSRTHFFGEEARSVVENARKQVAFNERSLRILTYKQRYCNELDKKRGYARTSKRTLVAF